MEAKRDLGNGGNVATPYIPVDLRSLVVVLRKAGKAGQLEELLKSFEQVSKDHPGTTLLLPDMLLDRLISQCGVLALCAGGTGTATMTLTVGTVISASRSAGFTYTPGAAVGPCVTRVSFVRVTVGGSQMIANTLTDTGTAWTGSIPAAL